MTKSHDFKTPIRLSSKANQSSEARLEGFAGTVPTRAIFQHRRFVLSSGGRPPLRSPFGTLCVPSSERLREMLSNSSCRRAKPKSRARRGTPGQVERRRRRAGLSFTCQSLGYIQFPILRFFASGTLVRWCTGVLVRWCSGAQVFWCAGALFTGCDQAPFAPKQSPERAVAPISAAPKEIDRITLKTGGVIEGKIVDEYGGKVTMAWQGGEVGFHAGEIAKIERNLQIVPGETGSGDGLILPEMKEPESAWPAGARQLLRLKTGEILGGELEGKSKEAFILRQRFEEGGSAVVEVPMERVSRIELWKPLPEMSDSLRQFHEAHPGLKYTRKGNYQILTSERDPADLRFYLNVLDRFFQEFVVHFFELIDFNQEPRPLDVIFLGTRGEFDEMLRQIGFRFQTTPAGFYHYQSGHLVFYNAKTDPALLRGRVEARALREKMEQISGEPGSMAGVDVQKTRGSAERIADQAARNELRIMAAARARTTQVVRHEGGHQLFDYFRITPFDLSPGRVFSGIGSHEPREVAEGEELLTDGNFYQGAWLVEGLAVYCETDPIGDVHPERLAHLRFALEENTLLPLEFLTNFSRGTGIHELDRIYANLSYSQSWAFVYFLMQAEYRARFFDFIRASRDQTGVLDAAGEQALFEQIVGKSFRELNPEFTVFAENLVKAHVDDTEYEAYRLNFLRER